MYDSFSVDYDRFVNWPERLAAELPFIEGQLQAVGACHVLDAACGTGVHAIALAQRGYKVVGTDLSAGMVERARANARAARAAAAADVDVRFEVVGFGELAGVFSPPGKGGDGGGWLTLTPTLSPWEREPGFDAVLCLGNSLPHLLTPIDLAAALADFAACLRPGGLLLIQNRNFDAVLNRGERWMGPQAYREGETEWMFLRFYDFESDGTLTFNVVTLRRERHGDWSQHVATTRLWPLQQEELIAALETAGFGEIVCWGDMQESPFELETSGNLVVSGRLAYQLANTRRKK
ncbi:MAG: methyltransferase domain-containing protein [Anaerolineae bacterium]|nr:methyltransferase domain-containing protein [Anaerolineae bacterium]